MDHETNVRRRNEYDYDSPHFHWGSKKPRMSKAKKRKLRKETKRRRRQARGGKQ